jgi:hypothetical protein
MLLRLGGLLLWGLAEHGCLDELECGRHWRDREWDPDWGRDRGGGCDRAVLPDGWDVELDPLFVLVLGGEPGGRRLVGDGASHVRRGYDAH